MSVPNNSAYDFVHKVKNSSGFNNQEAQKGENWNLREVAGSNDSFGVKGDFWHTEKSVNMENKIDVNMRSEEYAMALLGASIDSSLYGQILSKVKTDAITNTIFQAFRKLLEEKYDFTEDAILGKGDAQ